MAKELSQLILKDGYRYAQDHEWAAKTGETVRVGISDYAQDRLGDIVFVELPELGAEFAKGEAFGTVESTKAVSELYMPVGGRVLAVNTALAEAPERVNASPYDDGWMIEIAPADPAEFDTLMDKAAYLDLLKGN